MKITREWLEEREACSSQVEKFAAEWPDGAEITEASLLRAAALGLNLDWLARKVLKAPAYEAYLEAMVRAAKECQEATATAWKAYRKVCKEYLEATAPAEKAYRKAKAITFWRIWSDAA